MKSRTFSAKAARGALHRLWPIAAILVLAQAGLYGGVMAQEIAEKRAPDETLQVPAGSVFEIEAETDGRPASVIWVLTRDRAFVEAGRDRLFRARLTQPGTYLLESAADFPLTGERVRKNLTLDVGGPEKNPPAVPAGSIVRTIPGMVGNTVALSGSAGILTLLPSADAARPVHADIDAATDSSGDGIADNDDDVPATLFASEGSPLRLWFVFPRERTLKVWSGERQQTVSVALGAVAGIPPVTSDIVARDMGGGEMLFSFETGSFPANIIHQWNFGDGAQSLQRMPSHRYTRNGQYQVTVTVRDLQNGSTAGQSTAAIDVNSAGMAGSGATATTSSAATEPGTSGTPLLGGMLSVLLKIGIVGLIAVALGALAMWAVSKMLHRKGGGSLQKRLENAEATLAGTKPEGAIDTPAPLELRRSEPVMEAPSGTATATAKIVPPPADYVDVNKAPAWLKQGLKGEKKEDQIPVQPEMPAPDMPGPSPDFIPAPELPLPSPPPPAADSVGQMSVPEPPAVPSASVQTPEPLPLAPLPSEEELLPPWLGNQPGSADAQPTSSVSTIPAPSPELAPPAPMISEPPAVTPATEPVAIPTVTSDQTPLVEPVPGPGTIAIFEPAPQPEPVPVPQSPTKPAPSPLPDLASNVTVSPSPVPPAPILPPKPSSAPVLKPKPRIQSPVPGPLPPKIVSPTLPASTQVTVPPQAPKELTAQEKEREERERERKRRKRQRYRENLKKRSDVPTPATGSAVSAPAQKEIASQVKQAPVPPATKPLPPAKASLPKPLPQKQLAAPVRKPATVTPPVPAPASPAMEPGTTSMPPAKNDDSVAFIIKAEGIQPAKDDKKSNA